MPKINTRCVLCDVAVERYPSEVNRRGGRVFCSRKCSALAGNDPRKSKEIVLTCPGCNVVFKTTTHNKAKRHCSSSCASKASMSPERREAQRQAGIKHAKNLSIAAAMKSREAWKYELLKPLLQNESHEFECKIGGFLFDLVLHDRKIAVEFDGPEHLCAPVAHDDAEKEKAASEAGFIVLRRNVERAQVILPSALSGIL